MTQKTMTQTPETETRADLSKTIKFLRKKVDSVCETAALEMMGKSEEEMRIIWARVTKDFWNMGMDYFVREHSKTPRKLLKIQ